MKQARVGRGGQSFEVRLPNEEALALRRLAKRGGFSYNWAFIEAVRAWLEMQGEAEKAKTWVS